MPQRQGDADNPSRRGAGDQVEIRSDRTIEVLFQFRQEGCRERAENAASVNTQEAALPLPRPFVFSYQWRLLMSGPAGSALVIRDRPNDPLQDRSRQWPLPLRRFAPAIRPSPCERADPAPSASGLFCAPRKRSDCRGIIAPSRCSTTYRRAGTRPAPHIC